MGQYYARNALPSIKHRYSQVHLQVPEPRLAQACETCGERSVYCVHKRKNSNTYMCENCYRKLGNHDIAKAKQWLWDHKAESGCALCEEHDPRCLDYHHVHPKKKKFSIGSMPTSIPTRAIMIEMKKCVVVCANCHRQLEAMKKQQNDPICD